MVLNIMRYSSGSVRAAGRNATRSIYVALIRSVIDYKSAVYQSAAQTLLNKLAVIQNTALRLRCGTFKSSQAIAVEMGKLPLRLIYKKGVCRGKKKDMGRVF